MIMKPISMLLSFVYTPMVLAYLGDEKYGVWAIILNIVTWINIFDIGIGNGLRNRLAETYTNQDYDNAKNYVSTAYAGTAILSLAFCIVFNLVWNIFELSSFFNLKVSGENVDIAILVSVAFVCTNFTVSLSKTSAYAVQKSGAISVTSAFGQVIQIAILFVISKIFNQSLIAVAIMYGVANLLENFFLYLYITKDKKYLVPHLENVNLRYMKSMMTLGIGFFVMQICSIVLNTTDSLLISRLFGSADVTPYNLAFKVYNVFVQIQGIIIMPMWSAYTEAYTRHEFVWIKKTIRRINIITTGFTIGCLCLTFVFRPLMRVWLRNELDFSWNMILFVMLYTIFQMYANNYSALLCGVGYIKISVILCSISAIINIPLSIFLSTYCGMGIDGVVLGSTLVMGIGIVAGPIQSKEWFKKVVKESE